MARYYGAVGYAVTSETSTGVWTEEIVEHTYRGDVVHSVRRLENGEWLNDDINVNNTISIIADEYAYEHFYAIRYATFGKVKWKVTSVEVERPRLTLSLGGVYNGNET